MRVTFKEKDRHIREKRGKGVTMENEPVATLTAKEEEGKRETCAIDALSMATPN
jgi:hypothetical protein